MAENFPNLMTNMNPQKAQRIPKKQKKHNIQEHPSQITEMPIQRKSWRTQEEK